MEKKLCKCGCGEEVNSPGNLYVHGHNRRGLVSCTKNERWAMNYDKCIECGTTERKHIGKGLCTKCHRSLMRELKKQKRFSKWARKYDCCVDCGRIDRPHAANGRCGTCDTNYHNRQKGKPKRNFGAWSWYYDACKKCGTTKRPHVKNGLCYDCYREFKRGFSDNHDECPICGVKTIKLNQHLSMRAKKCKKHRKYQFTLFKKYFNSDLSVCDLSKELCIDRHTISRKFVEFFGEEVVKERNDRVGNYSISKKAKINFNNKNRFGTVVYYDSLNNGTVRFRSKLERKFAVKLDKLGVGWVYEYKSFPYLDEEGKRRTYTPDFYLPNSNKYIEIKGFEKSDDQYKINCLREIGIDIEMIKEV